MIFRGGVVSFKGVGDEVAKARLRGRFRDKCHCFLVENLEIFQDFHQISHGFTFEKKFMCIHCICMVIGLCQRLWASKSESEMISEVSVQVQESSNLRAKWLPKSVSHSKRSPMWQRNESRNEYPDPRAVKSECKTIPQISILVQELPNLRAKWFPKSVFWSKSSQIWVAKWFWQHSGNILATVWDYSGNILAAFWDHSGNILWLVWQQSGNTLATFWE